MHSHGGRRSRAPGIFIAGLAGASLILSGTAHAVTTPTEDATRSPSPSRTARAAHSSSTTTASLTTHHRGHRREPLPDRDQRHPHGRVPDLGIQLRDPDLRQRGVRRRRRRVGVHGVQLVQGVPRRVRPGRLGCPGRARRHGHRDDRCLAFDFRFFSEEYIEYVDKGFNDAFVAQLNTVSVTVDPATQLVNAPGNFAGGAGDVISVDSGGPERHVDAHTPVDIGTTYDGATPLLTARIPVTPGTANSVFLTIFDQGDDRLDSAVFVDNMRYEDIDATKCKSLALDPYEGTTGVSPIVRQPAEAVEGQVHASPSRSRATCRQVRSPATWPALRASSRRRAGTPPARDARRCWPPRRWQPARPRSRPTPTARSRWPRPTPASTAIKAAIKKPAKLKAKAKKLLKKAKKLRAEGKIAKAKKLEKKAAKLIKRAKKLLRKPLGVINDDHHQRRTTASRRSSRPCSSVRDGSSVASPPTEGGPARAALRGLC